LRFHVVSLPHTQTTAAYNNCAFAQLTRRFCAMMTSLGHEVVLYSGEDNDAPCAEHVTCITKLQQMELMGVSKPADILKYPFAGITYEPAQPWWRAWNKLVLKQASKRLQPGDFLCLIAGGVLFEPLIEAVHDRIIVAEYAVGYAGVSKDSWHCFGSSNWQHVVFGLQQYANWRGRPFDRVIPHYFDTSEFEYREIKDDYFLYLGKLKEDKGVGIASMVAKELGARIIFAGQGPTPIEYGEVQNKYIGVAERRDLLAGARALFVPSLYVEPFGMVAVEALLSGTPLITSPWGGLGEINVDGATGYTCHILRDFMQAAREIDNIDPAACRERGLLYDMHSLKYEYQNWFADLDTLRDKGWYATQF